MKHAHYNETDGKLLGWYDSEIHGTFVPEVQEELAEDGNVITPYSPAYTDLSSIPTPNIEVSEADWQVAVDSNHNYVDTTTGTLSTRDFRTFSELQTAKINELKSAYELSNSQDIAYMSTTFQADKESQNLIVSVLSAGSVPDEFFWLDKSNNQVPMTYVELQGLSMAILVRSQQDFAKYQDLKAQVKAATTQTKLKAVAW